MFSDPLVWKDLNKEKMSKNLIKKLHVLPKNSKIWDGKMLKPLNYHQKLRRNLFVKPKEGSLTPRADKKSKNVKNFKKLEKNCKMVSICVFSKRLFISSKPREGGGLHRGLLGGTLGWGGATARWGVGAIGGATVGVSSTSKNRPSHHKYKYESPKQFELKQS